MTENATHIEMHRDHQHWLGDHSMWRDDLNIWTEETQKALDDLAELGSALRRLAASIRAHEESLDRHIDCIRLHEHSLSEFQRTGQGETVQMLALAKAHREEAAEHAREQKLHEQLKREHHTVMAHWNLLLRELTRPAR